MTRVVREVEGGSDGWVHAPRALQLQPAAWARGSTPAVHSSAGGQPAHASSSSSGGNSGPSTGSTPSKMSQAAPQSPAEVQCGAGSSSGCMGAGRGLARGAGTRAALGTAASSPHTAAHPAGAHLRPWPCPTPPARPPCRQTAAPPTRSAGPRQPAPRPAQVARTRPLLQAARRRCRLLQTAAGPPAAPPGWRSAAGLAAASRLPGRAGWRLQRPQGRPMLPRRMPGAAGPPLAAVLVSAWP